VIKYIQ